MSAEVVEFDLDSARRRVERIRLLTVTVNENMEKIRDLVHEAKESNDHVALGYPSWPAYLLDLFGDEPLRLARDVRQEFVQELAAQGMSTRAIAPIVGVDNATVHRDLGRVANATPEPAPLPVEDDRTDWVNPVTGEVTDSPTVTEHTVTEKTKVTFGLDGKTYTQKPKRQEPKVLEGDALLDYDAKQAVERLSTALHNLEGLHVAAHRGRILNLWWPRAVKNEEVPLYGRDLFNPESIRQIAQGLHSLANELEEGMK